MTDFYTEIVKLTKAHPPGEFRPVARYNELMDSLVYVRDGGSYSSQPINKWVTVLWHPYEKNVAVGIKLKGIRHIFHELQKLTGVIMGDDEFNRLIRWFEEAVRLSLGDSITNTVADAELRKKLTILKAIIPEAPVIPDEEVQKIREMALSGTGPTPCGE